LKSGECDPTTAASLVDAIRESFAQDCPNPDGSSDKMDDTASAEVYYDGAWWSITVKRLPPPA
jgi:hypothetical protein